MKFFTFEWWTDYQRLLEGLPPRISSDPSEAYAAHLRSIRERLPPPLRRLEDDVSLHDGWLTGLRWLATSGSLQTDFEVYDEQNEPVEIRVVFGAVQEFQCVTHGPEGLPGPAGFGDIGYSEVDVEGELYAFRVIFSSGIELNVLFREVTLRISGRS